MAVGTIDDTPNFAVSALAAELSAGGAAMWIDDPSLFPAPTAGYNAVIFGGGYVSPHEDDNREIVRITAKPDSYTISRAQEGTSAQTWPAGSKIMVGVSNKFFADLRAILLRLNRETIYHYMGNLQASVVTPTLMDSEGIGGYVTTSKHRMMRDGCITGFLLFASGAFTAGGVTAEVYINGSATGLSLTLDTGGEWYKITLQDYDSFPFLAGSRIDVYYTTTAGLTPTGRLLMAKVEVTTP